MASSQTTNSKLCSFYFTSVIPNDKAKNGEWVCNKCNKVKLKSGGWTNLLNHLASCVGLSYKEEYERLLPERSLITSFVLRVNDVERDMYKWIEWVIMNSLAMRMVDDPLTREGMRYKPITSKLLRKNILSLCSVMRNSIKSKLPSKVAIIFDGWSEGTVHYIGVSASYCLFVNGVEEIRQTLLSMRPLLTDEVIGMTAQDHLHHLAQVMRIYGKTENNIMCFVGDNCNVNKCMAALLKIPLIGCGSHKFNLAVKKWISNQPQLEDIIEQVSAVMKKASTLKVSALLRQLTSLRTVRENDTRWSSTFQMCERFFRIQAELSAVADLRPLLPSLVECDILSKAFEHLARFNTITVMLQKEDMTFLCVRDIFDNVMIDYPELAGHLSSTAKIVNNPVFERAVVQIAMGHILTEDEKSSVSCLLLPIVDDSSHWR